MKKKIVALMLCIAMLAIAVVGGTLAYFTDNKEVTNTFTVGNVKIELTEPEWKESGFEDAPEVYPGEALAKDPTVKNIGANPCFVRIKVEGLDCLGEEAGKIIYRTKYVDGALGTDWVLHTDGYFYYYVGGANGVGGSGVLAAGKTTVPLFDQIVIPTALKNGDGSTKFNVNVTAEAVQAQGAQPSFAAVQAMTVAEIADWFYDCGL